MKLPFLVCSSDAAKCLVGNDVGGTSLHPRWGLQPLFACAVPSGAKVNEMAPICSRQRLPHYGT